MTTSTVSYTTVGASEMGALVLSSRVGVVVIAGYAAGRFEDLERHRVREGAQMMIDGDNETWRRTAPDVMALNEQLAHAAVELAWAEAEPPVERGWSWTPRPLGYAS
jgi:hypothetical protein